METGALVAKAFFAGAQCAEVLSRLWYYIVVKIEDDPRGRTCGTGCQRGLNRLGSLPEADLPSLTVTSK